MRNKKLLRLMSAALCVCLLFCLVGCGADNVMPGTGEAGKVAFINWEEYDRLLMQSELETDDIKRALLLHEAEDLLMDSGALIPIYRNKYVYLQKPDIVGLWGTQSRDLDLTMIHKANAAPDEPLSLCVCSEPHNLDPVATTTTDVTVVDLQIFRGLLKFDEEKGAKPDMAESYTVSEDKRVYTFRLRDDLKWSDGSPLNADDFVYSWKRGAATENGLEYGSLFNCIKGYPNDLHIASSENGKVLTVELNGPCAYFPYLCAFTSFFAVSRKSVESADGFAGGNVSSWGKDSGFLCSGPYTVDKWTHDESIILKKNPNYYNADDVYTETIELMISRDSAVSYAAYTSGDISVLAGSIPADIQKKLKGTPEYHETLLNACTSVVFNVCSPLFEGMTVEEAATFRKALGWAIDREFIVNVALTGTEAPALSYIPPTMRVGTENIFGEIPGHEYPMEDGYYSRTADLEKAREMLRSIGFEFGADGKRWAEVACTLVAPRDGTYRLMRLNDWWGRLVVNGEDRGALDGEKDMEHPKAFEVRLRAGENRLVLKTRAGSAGTWFAGLFLPGDSTLTVK